MSKADAKLNTHVVNNAMAQKMSGLWWLVSGDPDDRRAVGHHLATMDRYHLMPNGVHSGDEHYAGTNPSQGTELCAVVEGMFSVEQLLAILGDPALSDRLEKMTFNALPGTFDGDMWARMATADGGLVASAYGPSEVKTTVRGNVAVTLTEDTEYPFRDRIGIDVKNPARSPVVDWEVHPTTAWNDALAIDPAKAAAAVTVTEKPLGPVPFSAQGAPVELRVPGRRLGGRTP